MAIEFTVDHDHTWAGEEGIEPLIGWITFTVGTYPGDFRVREQGAGVNRTINLPQRKGWLAADGHLYRDQTLEFPCRLVGNDPAFNLEHLTYRADFELTTLMGDPITVPHAYFPAPSTDTTMFLTRVMADPAQPVMQIRAKLYMEDILDLVDGAQNLIGDALDKVLPELLPGAVSEELAARDLWMADAGGGQIQFMMGDQRLGDPVTIPSATWTAIAGKPPVIAAGDTAYSSRSVIEAASRSIGVNVLDYISDPADTTTHRGGFQDAIDAAIAAGGYEIVIPAGDWHVEGLVLPKKTPLKFRGHGSNTYAQRHISTVGETLGTRLVRTGELPVFIGIGGQPPTVGTTIVDNNTAPVQWTDLVRDVVIEDVTLENRNTTTTAPLIDLRGAGGFRFNRVVFYSESQNCTLVELTAAMDSSFLNCYLLGGATGLKIHDGTDTYFASNAMWFNSCDIENYRVCGIDVGEDDSTHAETPRLLRFSDHKMEGPTTDGGSHIILRRATGVMFSNAYIGHWNTAAPVVDVRKVNGLYGDIGFIRIFEPGYVDPSARVAVSSSSHFVDLNVLVHSGPDATVNVITQGDVNDATVNIRINGLSHKINGSTRASRFDDTATVWQRSAATACQYAFDRAGFNRWFVGNPTSPSGDQQTFSITASDLFGNTSQVLRLSSYSHTAGSNPATALYRDMNLSAFLNLSSTKLGWVNFQNLVSPPAAPVGGFRLYASGNKLTVDGNPIVLASELADLYDLTSGEATMTRRQINANNLNPGNNNLRLTYFTAQRTETVTKVRTVCNVVGAGATLSRIGVYSEDPATGNLTLVASTPAADTTLWTTTGAVTKTLTAPFTKTRGVRYAVGILTVGTTTSPQLHGNGLAGLETWEVPRLSAIVAGQNDLPASIVSGGLASTWQQYYAALVP